MTESNTRPTVARVWTGAVRREDGDAYAAYMQGTGVAGYVATPGNIATLMLRRDGHDRCEFVMITLWESMDAVMGFAGDPPDAAVFYAEDDRFLVARDLTARHYEVVIATGIAGTAEPG